MATFVFPESWTNVIISIFHQRLRQFTSVFELVCTGTRVRTPRWPGWKVGSWRAKKPKWGHRFWIDQLAKNANALIDIHGKPVVQGRYSNIVGTTLIKTFHKPVPVPTQRQWWRSWLRSWWWWWCYTTTTTTTIPLLLLLLVPTITIIYIYIHYWKRSQQTHSNHITSPIWLWQAWDVAPAEGIHRWSDLCLRATRWIVTTRWSGQEGSGEGRLVGIKRWEMMTATSGWCGFCLRMAWEAATFVDSSQV